MDTHHILFCLYMDSLPLVRFPSSRHPLSPLMIFYVHIPLHARSTSHVQLLFYIVIVLWWWLLNLCNIDPLVDRTGRPGDEVEVIRWRHLWL